MSSPHLLTAPSLFSVLGLVKDVSGKLVINDGWGQASLEIVVPDILEVRRGGSARGVLFLVPLNATGCPHAHTARGMKPKRKMEHFIWGFPDIVTVRRGTAPRPLHCRSIY